MNEIIIRKSFILHIDSLEVLDDLTDEQAGKLFKAIRNFNQNSELPNFKDQVLKICYKQFQNQFIRDIDKYEKKVKTNRENGKEGGRPTKVKEGIFLNTKTKTIMMEYYLITNKGNKPSDIEFKEFANKHLLLCDNDEQKTADKLQQLIFNYKE